MRLPGCHAYRELESSSSNTDNLHQQRRVDATHHQPDWTGLFASAKISSFPRFELAQRKPMILSSILMWAPDLVNPITRANSKIV